jgi:HSP70 co-chaperone SNL1
MTTEFMDTVIPHFYKAIESTADVLSPYIAQETLDKTCAWLKEHDTTVIWSTLGALVVGTLFIASGGSGSGKRVGKKGKQEKKFKLKIKKQPVIKIDPVTKSYDTIGEVNKELATVFIPQVEKLEADIALEKETGRPIEVSSYKEGTEYRYLYLQEALLKLLMGLDGVDPQLLSDSVSDAIRSDIRYQRKAAVKAVQAQCKRVDALKPPKK